MADCRVTFDRIPALYEPELGTGPRCALFPRGGRPPASNAQAVLAGNLIIDEGSGLLEDFHGEAIAVPLRPFRRDCVRAKPATYPFLGRCREPGNQTG